MDTCGPTPNFDVDAVFEQLTTEEKVALTVGSGLWQTNGVPRLGVPHITLSDGPHGIRLPKDPTSLSTLSAQPATCFPTASALASSWDETLLESIGAAIGTEARAAGVSIVLGPGVNIKRTPLCGRNFEYFSEDPLISGRMGGAWITGMRSTGVIASLKHFAANSQEHRRYSIHAHIDERALREIYLAPFEICMASDPGTIMTSYNCINTDFASENRELITNILRKEWGFPGTVISDWGAVNDIASSLNAGLDLEMPRPSGDPEEEVLKMLEEGAIHPESLNRAAHNVLTLIAKSALPQDQNKTTQKTSANLPDSFNAPSIGPAVTRQSAQHHEDTLWDNQKDPAQAAMLSAHHTLAVEAAVNSTVLLKNDQHTLPLQPQQSIALIGNLADNPQFQGGGSSQVYPTRVDRLTRCLPQALSLLSSGTTPNIPMTPNRANKPPVAPIADVRFAPGYDLPSMQPDPLLIQEAAELAAKCDVAIVVVGLQLNTESEGYDRTHLGLPASQNMLVQAVAAKAKRTVVINISGAPVMMPWQEQADAIIQAYLSGQGAGESLARVLTGMNDPGGRLAESFPIAWEKNPVSTMPLGPRHCAHRESIYVGYRYWDTAKAEVAFPFGHGLSYANMHWGDLQLDSSAVSAPAAQAAQALANTDLPDDTAVITDTLLTQDERLVLRIPVTNHSDHPAKEVVQIYVSRVSPSRLGRPSKELRGFQAVHLKPGETREVEISLDRRAFSHWCAAHHCWTVEIGTWEIAAGHSSRNIHQKKTVEIVDGVDSRIIMCSPPAYQNVDAHSTFPLEEFETLIGRKIPPNVRDKPGEFTVNTPLADFAQTRNGALIRKLVLRQLRKQFATEKTEYVSDLADQVIDQVVPRMLRVANVPMPVIHNMVRAANYRLPWKRRQNMSP